MNDLNEVNAILKRIINGVAIAVKKLTAIEEKMLNTTIDKEFAELRRMLLKLKRLCCPSYRLTTTQKS